MANADWNSVPGYGVILDNQPGAECWPMTAATFILVHKQPPRPPYYIFTASLAASPGDDVRTVPRLGEQVKLNTWKKQLTPLAHPRPHSPLFGRREGRLRVAFDPNPQVVQRSEINMQCGYTFDDNETVHPNFSSLTLYAGGLKTIGSKGTPTTCRQPSHCFHKFVVADEIKGERWLIV